MSTKLQISAGQYSDKGVKERNEDACAIMVPTGSALETKGICIAIADGVSSSEAAREASESCVRGFLTDYYSTSDSWTVKNSGRKVLGALNRWLYGQGQRTYGTVQGMLTTLSTVVLKSTTAHIFHVGDSRIYRIRNGEIKCLTRDHQTWISKDRAFLSRAMGADTTVEIDYRSMPAEKDDVFLLTTDGVHEYINDAKLLALYSSGKDNLEKTAKEIVTCALEQGSIDNATCQLVHIEQLPMQSEEEFLKQLTELPFPPPLEAGQQLDGYRIVRELHASNRSQVYLAIDVESETEVVLKTPSVNFEDDIEYIDGFLHEEWAGKRISSPHVLKIIEPSQRRRFLYYATEYIEGQTLEQWISDNSPADVSIVRPLVKQIITALRAFQRQEMIHQDLKPGNIMIDTQGTVKIIDFGSTKIAGIQEIASPINRGTLLGTLDYAAPEYFQGQPGAHISDIYSVGAIAYEMLTGKLPYGRPLSEKALKRVRYISAKHVNPNIPPWIDGALEKATQINPELRYPALSEFMCDLEKPNPSVIKQNQPLLERDPVKFWKSLSIMLFIANFVLLYLYSTSL